MINYLTCKKLTAAILISVIVFFTRPPVNAAVIDASVIGRAQSYTSEFFEMMMLLLEDYAGIELSPEYIYEAALRGISNELDPFTAYMDKNEYVSFIDGLSGHFEGIGVQIDANDEGYVYIHSVIPNTPAEEAGLLKGDIFLYINENDAFGLTQQQAADMIRSGPPLVTLEILRNNAEMSFTMYKRQIILNPVEIYEFGDIWPSAADIDNAAVRYMRVSSFDGETAAGFKEAVRQLTDAGVTGVVLDMRGNGGGYLDQVVAVARMVLPEGPIFYDVDASGEMNAHYSYLQHPPFKHIVILVDSFTASAAELLTAALQDSGVAIVVGETTYGKGVIQTTVELSTGGAFRYTYAEYLRRSGEKIDRIGVIPDVIIEYPGELPVNVVLAEDGRAEAIIRLKDILRFLGYIVRDGSDMYDEATRLCVAGLKVTMGLEEDDLLDEETAAAINNLLYAVYTETDVVLETGYKILLDMAGR